MNKKKTQSRPPWYKNFLEFFTVGALNATAEKINDEGDLLIVTHCMSQPKSRGYVTLGKCPNCKFIELHSNLLEDPFDRQTHIKAIRGTFELFRTKPFRDLGVEHVRYNVAECDTKVFDSDDYWDCISRYQSSCGSHPTGTSSMGPDDGSSVVDERARFYGGCKHLRQADAGM